MKKSKKISLKKNLYLFDVNPNINFKRMSEKKPKKIQFNHRLLLNKKLREKIKENENNLWKKIEEHIEEEKHGIIEIFKGLDKRLKKLEEVIKKERRKKSEIIENLRIIKEKMMEQDKKLKELREEKKNKEIKELDERIKKLELKNEEEKIDNYEGLKKIALIIKEERDEKMKESKKWSKS